jgi:hypothetical protein
MQYGTGARRGVDAGHHPTTLDLVHDRKARSIHHHLQGLIEGTDSPELAAEYRRLETQLFPIGLRVVQLPHIEEGGAAVALDRAIGPEQHAERRRVLVRRQHALTRAR